MLLFIIFGESANDSKSIACLTSAILPDGFRANIRPVRRPIVLCPKGSTLRKKKSNVEEISAVARAFQLEYARVITVAHRDCDNVEPKHEEICTQLESDLRKCGVDTPVAVVPAWEIEAWLLLFPSALQKYRSCWQEIKLDGREPGMIRNAKEFLTRSLRPRDTKKRAGCRDYTESDAPEVFALVKSNRVLIDGTISKSQSFDRFKDKIRAVL